MGLLKKSVLFVCLVAFLFSVVNLNAQSDGMLEGDYETDRTHTGPIEKFGRGITNVTFGVLEIPIKVYDVGEEKGGLAAITYGLFKGIAYTVARECVGVVDIITFPLPLPGATDWVEEGGWGYGPLMEPPYIIDHEHNIFNIVYPDSPMM